METLITNLYVLGTTAYLLTPHYHGMGEKMILVSYVLLLVRIAYIVAFYLSRKITINFNLTSTIQVVIPIIMISLYALNAGNTVMFPSCLWFHSIRIF